MSDAPDRLVEAVKDMDVDASLKLLADAGGSCKTRDLAKAATKISNDEKWSVGGRVTYSVTENGDKETLNMYISTGHAAVPIAGITQNICKR